MVKEATSVEEDPFQRLQCIFISSQRLKGLIRVENKVKILNNERLMKANRTITETSKETELP